MKSTIVTFVIVLIGSCLLSGQHLTPSEIKVIVADVLSKGFC